MLQREAIGDLWLDSQIGTTYKLYWADGFAPSHES
jgi:hypothetical protein